MLVRTMAEPVVDPKCPNCGESIVNMKDHFRKDYEFPKWKCRVPALDPDIKCPNCREPVKYTTDHFEGEAGFRSWKCKKQDVRKFDDVPRYVFDMDEKWQIEIYANKEPWKTIRSNGKRSISEMKIEQTDIFAQEDEHVDDTLREMGFKL